MLPPQMRDPVAALGGIGNPARNDPFAGQNSPLEDRASFSASMDMEIDLRDLYDLANKNNVAIYTVDPRGLATAEFGIEHNVGLQLDRQYLTATLETLRTLARETDGRAIINRNDLTIGMKQIVRDTSAYYLLGYSSTSTVTDGKFHEIKVRVKRPGVQVRARRGYWAFTRDDAARALAPPKPSAPKSVDVALAAVRQPAGSRVVRTWIGAERGANGKTKVTFVWEPISRTGVAPGRGAEAPARVSLLAAGPDGTPYFRGRVPDGDRLPAAASSATRVSFEAPPGKLQLRVSVEGASSEVLDSEVRELVVPDLTASTTTLGTPEVFRARTVRELQQLRADARATPVATREFSRTDRVLIRVPAYGRGSASPTVTAKLLNRAGNSIADLPVAPSPVAGQPEIDLTLASFPVGEYVVEVTATGEGGEAKELIGFRIAG